jgi:hypothetical protein
MTRHGLPQFPPAASPFRPTLECALSLVSNAPKLSRAVICHHLPAHGHGLHRHSHRSQRQFGQIASRPTAAITGRNSATLSRKQYNP